MTFKNIIHLLFIFGTLCLIRSEIVPNCDKYMRNRSVFRQNDLMYYCLEKILEAWEEFHKSNIETLHHFSLLILYYFRYIYELFKKNSI